MLISPINQTVSSKMPSFRGLWGPPINNDHTEGETYIFDTKCPYYPFADETKEQIDKVVLNNNSYSEDTPGKGIVGDPWPQITSAAVTVMAALPFTSKEFLHYTMSRLPITKQRMIEKHIISKGLSIIKK